MVFKIIWSDEAYKTFIKNIAYLKDEWGENEIENFIRAINKVFERINKYPESYPASIKNNLIRKAKINKHIFLYYFYNDKSDEIGLITFWHNKQDPGKLKY